MATGGQLAAAVLDILQEPSLTEQDALVLLQSGADTVSSMVLLPGLEAEAVVQAVPQCGRVPMPADYHRNLFRAEGGSGRRIDVWNGRDQLMHYVSKNGSSVRGVCATGRHLLYLPIPTSPESLTIYYHRQPDKIDVDSSVGFLPAGFVQLLVHFACWQGFAKIEQGLEGNKIDTEHHKAEFLSQVELLRLHVREGVSLPPPPLARCAW